MQAAFTNQFAPITNFLFEIPTTPKRSSGERGMILEQFIGELNKSAGERYKKDGVWKTVKAVNPRYIAVKVSHLNTSELWYFLSMCRQSRSGFSKCFYGALKAK